MAEVRERWGDEELVDEKIQKKRLEWLGHLARMQDHRLPRVCCFLGAGHVGGCQEGGCQEGPPADWY